MPADPRFAETVYLVEADDFARNALWQRHNERARWESDLSGYFGQVGDFGGMPVTVCCDWARINGRLACFYFSPSVVTHSRMLEEWLREHFAHLFRGRSVPLHCDAMNFAHCIHAIEELNREGNHAG